MGYIPQEKCFRDGLIPLRDGSITGIEYSTVVLKGNKGLNLLKQQLDTLKEYTSFNKECALHVHLGGFPVDPTYIYILHYIWCQIQRELISNRYVPPYTFDTDKYKNNGKSYCKRANLCFNFNELYTENVGLPYLGNLYQPHPKDINKSAKWNIKARYQALNLINMLCYEGPKTVEFRFLRPSYNYEKIELWLYILNALLLAAEKLAKRWKAEGNCIPDKIYEWLSTNTMINLPRIFNLAYPEEIVKYLKIKLTLLRIATKNQIANGDNIGRDTQLEDEIFG
jgi:hypothetical protein